MNDKLIEEIKKSKLSGLSKAIVFAILSRRHKPQESLAELADRKGYYIHGITIVMGRKDCGKSKAIVGTNNVEAESKARQYLEGLEDHK